MMPDCEGSLACIFVRIAKEDLENCEDLLQEYRDRCKSMGLYIKQLKSDKNSLQEMIQEMRKENA